MLPKDDYYSVPQLATKMEYPEHIINTVVRDEQEHIKAHVLNSQAKRPSISQVVLDYAFGDDIPATLRGAAFESFTRRDALPEPIMETLVLSLQNPDLVIADSAARALSYHYTQSERILHDLDDLLDSNKERCRE